MTMVAFFAFSFMAKADEISRGTEFTEGFESGYPSTWTMIDADGDGNNWDLTHYVPAHTGNNSMYSYSYDNATGALTPDNYMVTSIVELVPGSTVSFWASTQDVNFPAEHFGVAVSADGVDFTTVAEWDLTAKAAGQWYEYTAYVGDYEGDMYLAIRHFNCSDQFMIKVDDVSLFVGEVPVIPCDPPTNFQGYIGTYQDVNGVFLSWDAPDMLPLHYNVYCSDDQYNQEVDPQNTECFVECSLSELGISFKLTAQYDECESDNALTPDGDDYLMFFDDLVLEVENEVIVNVVAIYNINGQRISSIAVEDLQKGVYIVQGVTENGKTIAKKIVK